MCKLLYLVYLHSCYLVFVRVFCPFSVYFYVILPLEPTTTEHRRFYIEVFSFPYVYKILILCICDLPRYFFMLFVITVFMYCTYIWLESCVYFYWKWSEWNLNMKEWPIWVCTYRPSWNLSWRQYHFWVFYLKLSLS